MARYARGEGKLIPISKGGEVRKGTVFNSGGPTQGLNRRPAAKTRVALPKGKPIGRQDVPTAVAAEAGTAEGTTPAQGPPALPASPSRLCGYCHKPVPPNKRAGTQFCSSNCKALAFYHKQHPPKV